VGVLIGNTFEAADIGGMAAALNLLLPFPIRWIAVFVMLAIVGLQIWGSYTLIRNIFRWLSLTLLAYLASAILAN
jgi:Mn2+/Fe2+ NRAMP family transporter